ncbi:MAG: M48 family peptidase, partial [Gammaproteobacteria bacterium]
NHSVLFWAAVERVMPDYRQHRQWLRVNGWQLVV